MNKLKLLTKSYLETKLNKRAGESKFGENIKILPQFTDIYEQLKILDVTYVILGLPEDVGVFANLGKPGTYSTWNATLKILLNIQNNPYTLAERVLILGHLDFSNEMKKVSKLIQSNEIDVMKARKLVTEIDASVSELITAIVRAGKIPIVIGGGHNNAYGAIKGTSLALKRPINVINFDAHSDYRTQEGRHSGNGFTYAHANGFLKNYFIFGLHENYTSENILETLNQSKNIAFNTFEDISIRKTLKFKSELKRGLRYVSDYAYGIELDCDAIQNIPSSAMTPSGFSVNKARRFIDYYGKSHQVAYLHICEAAPTPETETQVGKLITYLITDFIRAHAGKHLSI